MTRRERATPKRPPTDQADPDTLNALKAGLMRAFESSETPPAALAGIAREIRIIEATLGARPVGKGDPLDELAARRRKKAAPG